MIQVYPCTERILAKNSNLSMQAATGASLLGTLRLLRGSPLFFLLRVIRSRPLLADTSALAGALSRCLLLLLLRCLWLGLFLVGSFLRCVGLGLLLLDWLLSAVLLSLGLLGLLLFGLGLWRAFGGLVFGSGLVLVVTTAFFVLLRDLAGLDSDTC